MSLQGLIFLRLDVRGNRGHEHIEKCSFASCIYRIWHCFDKRIKKPQNPHLEERGWLLGRGFARAIDAPFIEG